MKKRSISIVLLVTILLQSCVAYQKTSVSLNDAVNEGKVVVITTRAHHIKYNGIEYVEGIYYGRDNYTSVALDSIQISSIHLEDIKKSKTQKIFLVIGVSVLMVIGIIIMVKVGIDMIEDSI